MLITDIPIFCLNLDRAADRWERVQQQLTALGHTVTRFAATDYRTLDLADVPPPWHAGNPNATSLGNTACSLTHYRFWQFLYESDLEMACVLEDDAHVVRPLRNLTVPDTFDLFYLTNRVQIARRRTPLLVNGCGTEGYIIHRRAVPKLLKIFSDVTVPIDLRLQAHMWGFHLTRHSLSEQTPPDAPLRSRFRSTLHPDVRLEAYGTPTPYVLHDDKGYSYINEPQTQETA